MAQLIPLTHLGIVRLTGDDTITFLQGQLTCNMNQLKPTHWSWGGHCDPKGKLLASFRIFKRDADVLLIMPRDLIAVDLPQMQKYAVFNKVELSDISDQLPLHGLLGDDALDQADAHFPGTDSLRRLGDSQLLRDSHSALVVGELPETLAGLDGADLSHWQQHEVAQAWPMLSQDHSGELVPQMLNLDAVGGIQYDKGCYIGQETIARMHFRGGNKRAMYIAMGSADALPEDTELQMAMGDNWRRAGVVLNQALVNGQLWLTTILAKELDADTRLRLGEIELTLQPRPYPLFGES
ncbi:hypothetical protein SAMN04488540_10780 [Ferrimonas sediminum]|uniref:tRNA-modifying protein YgfZ-like beta-barrel domain-containing protein n=1 Tax=Ferrimonas sediminum TaxID=718193 RepID=A0A1G8T3Y5_9GAMM|nr:folate-binding protein YgfZ [Ferrimonas sediminum]SDJ35400.1 hypothetical protein SAMN04488540_10780 [Ferrimonas sediminum]